MHAIRPPSCSTAESSGAPRGVGCTGVHVCLGGLHVGCACWRFQRRLLWGTRGRLLLAGSRWSGGGGGSPHGACGVDPAGTAAQKARRASSIAAYRASKASILSTRRVSNAKTAAFFSASASALAPASLQHLPREPTSSLAPAPRSVSPGAAASPLATDAPPGSLPRSPFEVGLGP